MNSRFALALAISAGMALVVTGVFYQLAVRGRSSAGANLETSEIVVAVKDLEIGSTIQATDLRLEPWPASKRPDGSFTEIEQVIERVPISRVLANEPVLERRLSERGSGVGLATKVPEGMRAMSVRVDDVNGVAGFVLPEARVDVLITGVPRFSPEGGQMTRTILGNVRVLSAGEQLEADSTGEPQRVPVVTLLLTSKQAEMVTLAQTNGRIQLVLRNSNDDEVAESSGVQESELFGGPPRAPVNVSKPPPPEIEPTPVVFEPPPPVEVEMIRGAERTVQTFGPGNESGSEAN